MEEEEEEEDAAAADDDDINDDDDGDGAAAVVWDRGEVDADVRAADVRGDDDDDCSSSGGGTSLLGGLELLIRERERMAAMESRGVLHYKSSGAPSGKTGSRARDSFN